MVNRVLVPVEILSAVAVLVAVGLAAQTVYVSFATHSALPIQDEWSNLLLYRSVLEGGHVLSDLFSQHNEHRSVFPRLILFSDYTFFGGRGLFALSVTFTAVTLLVGLFAFLLRRCRPNSQGSMAVFAMVLLLLFSLVQWENFGCAFQVEFVGVYAAASSAIVVFAVALDRERVGKRSAWLLLTAFTLVAIATFFMANGLLSGIVLVIMALLARASKTRIAAAVIVTALLMALYFFDYRFPTKDQLYPTFGFPSGGFWPSWLPQPVGVGIFTAAYLGNFLDPDVAAASLFGVGGLLALAAVFCRYLFARDSQLFRLALLGIGLFAAGSAFLTAIGRFPYEGIGGAMSSRYTTGSACFWSAMLICGWSLWDRPKYLIAVRLLLAVACLILVTAIVQAPGPAAAFLEDRAFQLKTIENALLQGLVDEKAIEVTYTDAAQVRELSPLLRARSMSVFASREVRLFGRPLSEAGEIDAQPCTASFLVARSDPALGRDGVRVNGTVAIRPDLPLSGRVYLVGPEGMIVGFASSPPGEGEWIGYATATRATKLQAFGQERSGRLCHIGTNIVSDDNSIAAPSPTSE
jgi:hypothetical protein